MPCPLERCPTAHGRRRGLIGLGLHSSPSHGASPPQSGRGGSSVCGVWCVTKTAATRDSPGQPSTALKPGLVKDLKYLSQKKKNREKKRKNRRKNPQAIPIFDLFPAVSTDLIQGAWPHTEHSTALVVCPACPGSLQRRGHGAVTLREPYLKGSKTLQGEC